MIKLLRQRDNSARPRQLPEYNFKIGERILPMTIISMSDLASSVDGIRTMNCSSRLATGLVEVHR